MGTPLSMENQIVAAIRRIMRAVDLHSRRLAEEHGPENLIVVFGLNEPDNLRIMTATFREGDPSYAGALAGVALGLRCYHILELKDEIPQPVWSEQMAMRENRMSSS